MDRNWIDIIIDFVSNSFLLLILLLCGLAYLFINNVIHYTKKDLVRDPIGEDNITVWAGISSMLIFIVMILVRLYNMVWQSDL
jgi:NADH:ubiquinone oxidoreductase subunit 3 (subunit A)